MIDACLPGTSEESAEQHELPSAQPQETTMAKGQIKTDKNNKPKLSVKEKKEKKAKKAAK